MRLAALDWSLIPCRLNKKPLIETWKPYQLNAPTVEQIRAWLDTLKPPAWAVITGRVSGVLVLDFDGAKGQQTLQSIGLDPHVRSGSGGYHAYLAHPGWHVPTLNSNSKRELGNRWPGLDIRADGGYAVCLGRNEKGAYLWLRDPVPDPLDLLPHDLRTFLGLAHPPILLGLKDRQRAAFSNGRVAAGFLIERAFEQIATSGRNNSGFWLAVQLRDNSYSEKEAESVVFEYAARVPEVNLRGEPEP
jgi:hypothetical protein